MYKIVFALILFGSVLLSESLKCYSCANCLGDLSKAATLPCLLGSKPACWTQYQVLKNGLKSDLKACKFNEREAQEECSQLKRKYGKDDTYEYFTCSVCTSDECNSDILKSASLLLVLSLACVVIFFNKLNLL